MDYDDHDELDPYDEADAERCDRCGKYHHNAGALCNQCQDEAAEERVWPHWPGPPI